jgi:acetylxylan esterase
MNRFQSHALAIASISLGLLVPVSARAASLVQVDRSKWTGGVNLPSYVQMYIYVPDKLAAKPPIMVSSHSCGSTATGQIGNIPKSQAAADKNGFILILPDNPGQNCWDVGTTKSLTHDGGGDTHAVAQMVKYTLTTYSGDASRVYAMGGSSGGMMTQALMAVYPDVFRAGSARAGVPAGCWADGYDGGQQWSNNCAGGNTTKTAMQWGDMVRAMDPNYTGHRPRLQTMQGEADTTISYKNTAEAIKEWTNVLGLPTAPTSTDKGYKAQVATYDRQFWKNACGFTVFEAWSSPGGTHSMAYEEDDILKYFGLDVAGGTDPEPDCNGMGGAGGMGAGGSAGMGAGGRGAGGAPAGGMGGTGGMATMNGGVGGTLGVGGQPTGGTSGTGAAGAPTGAGGTTGGTGMTAGTGGTTGGTGTTAGTGGSVGGSVGGTMSMGTAGKGGGAGTGGGSAGKPAGEMGTGGTSGTTPDAAGCGCSIGDAKSRSTSLAGLALGLAVLAFRRRKK